MVSITCYRRLSFSILVLPFYVVSTSVFNPSSEEQGYLLCNIRIGSIFSWARCSVYRLFGISLERYNVVVNPLSALARNSELCRKMKIAVCWIFASFVQVIVQIFVDRIKYSPQYPMIGKYCATQWSKSSLAVLWIENIVLFLLEYIVPSLFLCIPLLRLYST